MVLTLDSICEIPDGAMLGLVDYVSGIVARRLLDVERAAPYSQLVEIGEKRLRRFTATRASERSTRHRFF